MTSPLSGHDRSILGGETRLRDWYGAYVSDADGAYEKFTHHFAVQFERQVLTGAHILEVGCGQGATSLHLAALPGVASVVALDENAGHGAPVGVTAALEASVEALGIGNLRVVHEDLLQNSLPAEAFDLVVANNALHHLAEDGHLQRNEVAHRRYVRAFGELRRVLRPGGVLTVWEYSRMSMRRWVPIRAEDRQIEWAMHPTLSEWLGALGDAGFVDVDVQFAVPYSLRRQRRLLANRAASFFTGTGFILRCRK